MITILPTFNTCWSRIPIEKEGDKGNGSYTAKKCINMHKVGV
jgi:hypothetical protein